MSYYIVYLLAYPILAKLLMPLFRLAPDNVLQVPPGYVNKDSQMSDHIHYR